jgi:hypothetical protein
MFAVSAGVRAGRTSGCCDELAMTVRLVAAGFLLAGAILATGCKRRSHPSGSAVEAGSANDSVTSGDAAEAPLPIQPSQGEPTKEEQKESDTERRAPLAGEIIAQPEGGFLGFFPVGDDLIVGARDRVLRRSGADGSMQVLIEQPGLVWIDHQGSELLMFIRDKGKTWIERRPVDHPATLSMHRDIVVTERARPLAGYGWYWVTDAVKEYSPDASDPNGRWGDYLELGHVDAPRTWKLDLPDERAGGTFAGFSVTPKHVFWWALEYDLERDEEVDFRIHSIGVDGHTKVWRTIERRVMSFDVDEDRDDGPLVAWMDRSACESDFRTYTGVLWVAPLAGGSPRRIIGGQICARAVTLRGDDVFWYTDLHSAWWASVRTGQHMLLGGAWEQVRVTPSDRWVYIERRATDAGSRELMRVPWWR